MRPNKALQLAGARNISARAAAGVIAADKERVFVYCQRVARN